MTLLRPTLFAATLAAAFAISPVAAQQSGTTTGPDAARPANAAANRPSDSGAQNTLPQGAVTGAGQPQGVAQSPDASQPKVKRSKSKKKKMKNRTAKSRAAATRPQREMSAGETPSPAPAK